MDGIRMCMWHQTPPCERKPCVTSPAPLCVPHGSCAPASSKQEDCHLPSVSIPWERVWRGKAVRSAPSLSGTAPPRGEQTAEGNENWLSWEVTETLWTLSLRETDMPEGPPSGGGQVGQFNTMPQLLACKRVGHLGRRISGLRSFFKHRSPNLVWPRCPND